MSAATPRLFHRELWPGEGLGDGLRAASARSKTSWSCRETSCCRIPHPAAAPALASPPLCTKHRFSKNQDEPRASNPLFPVLCLLKLLEKSPPARLGSGPHPRCAGAAGARARGSGWKRCAPLNADSEMSTFIRGAVTARPRGLGALCSREPQHPRLHPARTPNPEP